MELNHLRAFYEVAKSGSFTEAARRLRISQSALSKAVALLEEAEGVKLLERSKKGVALTTIGADVFQKSESIFQTVVSIENACRGKQEKFEGTLRFGASDHISNYLLVKQAQRMRAEHPEVTLSILSGAPNELVAAILSSEVEFGLFFTRVNLPQIEYEELFSLPMAVVYQRKLEKTADQGRLRALVDKIGFVGSIQSQYRHHPSEELMKLLGKPPKISFESNSQETQKRLCLEGGGVAFLARFMVEKEIASGELAEVPLPKALSLPLLVAKRKGRPLSLGAKTFLGLLKD